MNRWLLNSVFLSAFSLSACSLYQSPGRECLENGCSQFPKIKERVNDLFSVKEASKHCYQKSDFEIPSLQDSETKWLTTELQTQAYLVKGYSESSYKMMVGMFISDQEHWSCEFFFLNPEEQVAAEQEKIQLAFDYIDTLRNN
jgi:hypothetical protein